jgi:hypothetical protein
VDGSAHFVAAERRDHPLDLPPMAETRDIALVAAAFGARGGLEPGLADGPFPDCRQMSSISC